MDISHDLRGAAPGSWSLERIAFVQKVYGLLTLALLVAIVGAFTGQGFSLASVGLTQLGSFVVLLAALVLRRVPLVNVGLLFGFALLNGMSLGPTVMMITGVGKGHIVIEALVLALGMFLALTAYVFWSKTDFSYLGGGLTAVLMGLVLVSLIGMFTGLSSGVSLLYAFVTVLVFTGFVLYDTSNLLHRYPPDEYVAATLGLFLDILNLFLAILRILMSMSSDD